MVTIFFLVVVIGAIFAVEHSLEEFFSPDFALVAVALFAGFLAMKVNS